jgi:hypothetical protein
VVSPPIDPVVHRPADDSYLISGRDMSILRGAIHIASRNKSLEAELISLRQQIEECTDVS